MKRLLIFLITFIPSALSGGSQAAKEGNNHITMITGDLPCIPGFLRGLKEV